VKPQAIDLAQGPRADAYAFYRSAHLPRWSLSTRVDVAPLLQALPAWAREHIPGLTPFVAYHHAVLRAANAVPALRQRLVPGAGAVEWPQVDATPTVLRPDDSFAVARLPFASTLRAFAGPALAAIAAAQVPGGDWGIAPEPVGELHMTTLPLVHFTHFSHARKVSPDEDDGTPAIALGAFQWEGERCWMPLNIEVHHALADGLHVGRFVQALQALLAAPQAIL
jgi:chloramphenicol O-acetyltransferase type A